MANERSDSPAPAAAARPAHSITRHMTPEMQREYTTNLTKMLGLHVNMLETASAKLKANDADESSCDCAVQLVNAICNCAGTALGGILSDFGL